MAHGYRLRIIGKHVACLARSSRIYLPLEGPGLDVCSRLGGSDSCSCEERNEGKCKAGHGSC